MKKKSASRSAFFNSRVLISFAFCAIGVLLALFAFALYPGATALARQNQPQPDAQALTQPDAQALAQDSITLPDGTLTEQLPSEPAISNAPMPESGAIDKAAGDQIDGGGACSQINGGLNPQGLSESGVAAPAGFFWSEVQHDAGNTTESNTSAGFSALQGSFRLADNFTLSQPCTINSIVIYAYQTGAPASPSPFTAFTLQISNGRPGDPGVMVVFGDTTTNRLASSVDSTFFRIFNTAVPPPGTAPGTTRKIWKNTVTVGTTLPAGSYWVDWASTVSNGGAHFHPTKTIPGARSAAGDNARQLTVSTGVWADVIDTGNPATAPDVLQDFPFEVIGTPVGGTPSPTPTATATATAGGGGTPTPSATGTPCAGTVLNENFDGVTAPTLPAGWVASNAAGGAPLWVTTTTTPDTAPNDAFIDDPAVVTDKRLDTPAIAVSSAAAQVSFRNFYFLESTFDGGVLEVSSPNINGGTFTDITNAAVGGSFVTGGYNATISTAFMSPIAGRMAWSGNAGGYINTVANLGANVAGQTIKLRFRMASDNSVSATGWRVDTVRVVDGSCASATPTATATATGGGGTPSCPTVITQSSTQTITTGNSVSCNNGVGHTDNSYWRAFNMGTFVGGAQYNVTSVSFGVESANNTQPVTVRLYTNSGAPFPGGTRTQIATSTISVTSAQTGTVVTTPLVVTVPAGTSELVMELFTPDGQTAGHLFFVGSNVDPESGPSYLSAAACGVTTPTPVAALGFPNMHIVFNVNGSCGPGGTPSATPTATATSGGGSVTPTPTCAPLTQGFDDITTLPGAGWVQINHSTTVGSTNWFQGNSTVFPAQSGAADSYIGANFNNTTGTNTISNWLLTSPVSLQNGATMTFYTRTVDAPSFPDRLQVRMSTNGASSNVGTTATDVGDFTTLLLDINPTYTTTGYPNVWTQFTVTVTGVPSATTGRLALRYFVENGGPTGANSDYIGIDTFQFTGACGTPTPGSPTPSPSCVAAWSAGATFPAVGAVRAPGNYFPANGRFYSIGGRNADVAGADFTNPFEYNPVTNTWATKVATYPDNKVNNMACGVLTVGGTPQIYCVGGNASQVVGTTGRVFSYNPASDTITALTAADDWPGSQTGTFLPGGFAVSGNKLYTIGSFNANAVPPVVTGQVWQFDPNAAVGSRWLARANYPVARAYVPAASIAGLIYTGGGSNLDAGGLLIDTTDSFKYDPATDIWTAIANIPRATAETRAVVVNNEMWVLGGGRVAPNPSNEVDIYHPGSGTWTTGLPFAAARRNFPADSDGSRVFLAGGYDTSGTTLLNTMEIFTGTCASPTPGTPTPTATFTPTATATTTGTPETPTPTPSVSPTTTPTPSPSVTPAAQPLNLSTRLRVETGDGVGIGGFIITGSAPKEVLLRGLGPSLAGSGVPDPLADPVMELHGPSGFTTIINDNWMDAPNRQAIIDTGLAPPDDLESAILVTLDPGPYTAIVRGNNNGTGVALVEVYDLDQAAASKLANISTRAFVNTGANIMIAGFILGNGTGDDNVILRGLGPSLTGAGVPDVLADPTLELRDGNGTLIRSNNDWQDDPIQAALITAAGLALPNPLESGIAATLAPGPYTALLAGLNSGIGNGLVEVYDLGTGAPVPSATPVTPSPTPTATATATAGGGTPPVPTPTPSIPPSPTPSGPCVENFDGVTAPALPAGWVASNPDPGDGTLWVTSTTTPASPPNAAFIPDQDGISDKVLDRLNVTINSTSPMMTFRNNFNTEFSGGTYWDGFVLEVSAPGISGGDFLDITDSHVGGSFVSGGYTGPISTKANNPLSGRMAWSSDSGGYIDTAINLGPNLAGQTVTLRFRMGTDEAVAAPGVNVDTISITGASCP